MTNLIHTPDGVFNSQREAAKFYNIHETSFRRRLADHPDKYFKIGCNSAHPPVTIIDLRHNNKR